MSVFSVALGPLVDRLQVRKTLLIHISFGLLSKIILTATLHRAAICVVLYGTMSMCMSLGVPVVPIALRRYTRAKFHTLAFAVHYVVMNMGAALSQPIVDGFRLGLSKYSGTKWMMGRPVWSYFLFWNCFLHVASLVVVYFWIHDVEVIEPEDPRIGVAETAQITQVNGKWRTVPVAYNHGQTWRQLRAKLSKIFRGAMLWKFVLLSVALVGAKAIYVYLIALYPLYMKRAPYPVDDPESMPFMTFLLINPIIVIAMTYPVGALVTHFKWDRFWVSTHET